MDLYLEGTEEVGKNSIKIKKGEFLFLEGERVSSFYILKSGKVCCFKQKEHRITPVYTSGAKEFVGEDCVFSSDVYSYGAIAFEDSVIIKIEKSLVDQFMTDKKDWMSNLFNTLTDRISNAGDMIASHSLRHSSLFSGNDFSNEDEAFIRNSLKGR